MMPVSESAGLVRNNIAIVVVIVIVIVIVIFHVYIIIH